MIDPVQRHPFERALAHIKQGGRAARAGWNGRGMWVAMGQGAMTPAEKFWNPHTKAHALSMPGAQAEVLPYLIMKTADDKILMGWAASQSDMLAADWELMGPIALG